MQWSFFLGLVCLTVRLVANYCRSMSGSADNTNPRLTLWRWIASINGLGAVIAAVFAVVSVVNPGFPGGSVNSLAQLYAGTYAVRAVPLAVVLVLLLIRSRPTPTLVFVLLIAGLAQGGDAMLGAIYGQPAMLVGGSVYAVIHLSTAAWIRKYGLSN
jgi:hypothetical protein